MLYGVDAIGIETDALDPVGKNFRHAVAHVGCLGAKIVEREQFAVFDLRGIAPVLSGAVVVKQRFERNTERRVVKRSGVTTRAVVAQRIAVGRILEIRKSAVATVDDRAAVIYDHIIDHQNAALVGGVNETFQIVERTHARVGLIKVGGRVTMIVAVAVEQDWRDPHRGRAKRFDVVELALRSLEVATVSATAIGGIEIRREIVIAAVTVEETVGDDLIDVLMAPEIRRELGSVIRILRQQNPIEAKPGVVHPDVNLVITG